MKKVRLSLPEISLIAGTRVLLGSGIALLYADRFTSKKRKALGWALFLAGAATTIPIGRMVLDRRAAACREKEADASKEEAVCEIKPKRFGWRKRI